VVDLLCEPVAAGTGQGERLIEVFLQLLFRFIVGGFVVSLFAVIGDVLKPKGFAGLFGPRHRSR
jgi:hypothetical protein